MQRLKIAQVFFSFETGGAQILAIELLNAMSNDHDVSLIIVNDEVNVDLIKQLDKRINITFCKRKVGSRNPIPVLRLNIALFKIKPDIIHCHEPNAVRLIKTRPGKVVYTIHDTGIPTTFYHLYDVLVAISNAVWIDVSSMTKLPVQTVFNGIPMDSFTRRRNYVLSMDEPVKLVQVSRLMHEKKGQDILLRALQVVVQQYNFSNFSLEFIGGGSSMEMLKQLAEELGLSGQVHFPGEKNREWLFKNLASYHLLVQPSRYEGFGLTILEGFAAGLPVVASDIAGPAEIIEGMPGGFLFKNEDVADCAKMLFHAFSLYQNNKVGRLMEETIPVIKGKYSAETCAAKYLEVYRRSLSQQPVNPVFV